jgi:CMP-N,N'-diacetyllegionaminic acid synthase
MRILAVVPARGGSKRLPGKNIQMLGDRPLIAWSIQVASGIADICDILVSTDDPAIANIAKSAGALVPWLRPEELASDTATSVDVCIHALDWYEEKRGHVDGMLLLQPTSPFRSRETVLRGIEMFHQNQRSPVVAVSPAESHPLWCFKIEGNSMRPFVNNQGESLRTQDLPPAYRLNGVFYLITPFHLRTRRSFFGNDMLPLTISDQIEIIDIDTAWDWAIAEMAVKITRGR